ncbi:nodulation protein NfeD [Hahella aquimaris]|uniref:NfeD family protein n=1 Tax=Hahella sp. HNIBRBA332 TaxID=3015983 RepID=UPI00273CA829|nr:nodulation protein NfeD [Hahella sp. HNIBRBA332]WLQ11768.1 nodulation protein NfeD [Hahella sp. HNIBRBA332]
MQFPARLLWLLYFAFSASFLFSSFTTKTLAAETDVVDAPRKHPPQVWTLDIQGAIGPASADLFMRALEEANEADASLFLLRLDTPGGLDKSMRDMIQAILASSTPVAAYVYPKGARAASAGTYILYSSHVAAMAHATNLGAATPISIAAPSSPTKPDGDAKGDEKGLSTLEHKQINDAVAYIQGLAKLRGRNAEWAERAVRDAASLSAEEALQMNVIDMMADSTEQLLAQLEGRQVNLDNGAVTLKLSGYELHPVVPDWRNRFLAVITDPSVAYILLLIGIYGLLLEAYNPGAALPGILGAICLLIGLYALQLLPISYAGLGLLLLGVALMTAEGFAPSFGALGLGGVAAFVLGSVMLMDTKSPAYQIALPVIIAVAALSVLVLSVLLHFALKSRKQAVVSGMETLIGSQAEAIADFTGSGRVAAQGQLWMAYCDTPVTQGQKLRITGIQGLTLQVEAIS